MTHTHIETAADQSQEALYLYLHITTIPDQNAAALQRIRQVNLAPEANWIPPGAHPESLNLNLTRGNLKSRPEHAIDEYVIADEKEGGVANDATARKLVSVSVALGERDAAGVTLLEYSRPESERAMLEFLWSAIDSQLNQHAEKIAFGILKTTTAMPTREDLDRETALRRQVPIIVTHDAELSLRFLLQRCIILEVNPPNWWPRLAHSGLAGIEDTMTMWLGNGRAISLDKLCRALRLPSKIGSDETTRELRQLSDFDLVEKHTCQDLRRIRTVHRRLRGLPMLKVDQIAASAA